jgi:ABC-type nitrate/sulfonate/bicarbonate transport system substrate-binding protein
MAPIDMLGHKIGTMEGSPVDLIYQALKKKENLNIKKNDEIPTGWALTGFLQNEYDVYPAFFNDEPVTLKLQGIDVNVIQPSYYDVNFIGTVYFCKKELVDCCPEIVQSFINAISLGWELTIKDPSQAISILRTFDKNIDERKEKESLMSGLDYYKGEDGNILYVKEDTWNKMSSQLKDIGQLGYFDYRTTVETKFVSWYLSKVKPLNDENAKK